MYGYGSVDTIWSILDTLFDTILDDKFEDDKYPESA